MGSFNTEFNPPAPNTPKGTAVCLAWFPLLGAWLTPDSLMVLGRLLVLPQVHKLHEVRGFIYHFHLLCPQHLRHCWAPSRCSINRH